MTNSELKTNEAIQSINRKMRDQKEIDWEQRRYEIAKESFCAILHNFRNTVLCFNVGDDAIFAECAEVTASVIATRCADALIAELKDSGE